jgi:ppGpp synthetase/RelA/SpoT-type nucleotidyltranferase
VSNGESEPTGEINKACQRLAKLRMASISGERDIASLQPDEVTRFLADQEAADDVSRRLRKNWKAARYRDYVRAPKDSGYRALHLTVIKQSLPIEVQLRTYLQDVWANQFIDEMLPA